ncbi:MAG: cysteine peptidase family C39 domain-containing protein [Pirellulales bacterium]
MDVLLALALAVTTQSGDVDVRCGAYCTYASLRALDISAASYEEFQQRLGPPDENGYSMAQLSDVARMYGAQTLGVATTLDNLQRRSSRFACIVRVPPAHFVVLSEVAGDRVVIVDPPRDYAIPSATFQSRWDGTALLISAAPLVPEEELAARGWPTAFWASFGAMVFSLIAIGTLWVRRSRS